MNRLSESSSKSACSELGTVLLFLSPCFIETGGQKQKDRHRFPVFRMAWNFIRYNDRIREVTRPQKTPAAVDNAAGY